MCTHLHVDHVGWNTKLENGRWVPTFPNAKYLFAKREYAHWETERGAQGEGKVNDGSFDDSVLPIVEAGKAVMIESDHQPDPLLTIKDYPGHTPGSIAINLKDEGRSRDLLGRYHASSDPGLSSRLVEPVLLGSGHVGTSRAARSWRIASRATRSSAPRIFQAPMRVTSNPKAMPSGSTGIEQR